MIFDADTHKQCSKCKEIKEFGEFYKNNANKGGFSGSCKICINNYQRVIEKIERFKKRIDEIYLKDAKT